jgi:hypothetical protein
LNEMYNIPATSDSLSITSIGVTFSFWSQLISTTDLTALFNQFVYTPHYTLGLH